MTKQARQELIERFVTENKDNPEKYRLCPPASEAEVMMSFKERDELRKARRRAEREARRQS